MKIENVEFFKSVDISDQKVYFDEKKEIVFVGRSNVGKSSLLNTLFIKKHLAYTSATPWKTRTANIFVVNHKYYFTDLPGYGFAKMGKENREKLDALISWYLEERKWYIKNVVMILDSKIGPQKTDLDMFQYISELWIPLTIVLNKIDKLSNNDRVKSLKHAEELFFGQKVCLVSALWNQWVDDLRKYIFELLK